MQSMHLLSAVKTSGRLWTRLFSTMTWHQFTIRLHFT